MSLKLKYFILFSLLFFHNNVFAQEHNVDDYVKLYKDQTSNCGTSELCCVRRVFCATGIFEKIREDTHNQLIANRKYKANSLNSIDVFRQLILKLEPDFTNQSCPANVKLAFTRFYNTNRTEMNIVNQIRQNEDVLTELFTPLNNYIEMYPNLNGDFLQCDTFFGDVNDIIKSNVNDIVYFSKLTTAALTEKDYFAAKTYAGVYLKYAERDEKLDQQAMAVKLIGDSVKGLNELDEALVHYRRSIDLAKEANAAEIEIDTLQSLLDILDSEELEKNRLDIYIHIADLYESINKPIDQASYILEASKVLGADPKNGPQIQAYINQASSIFEENESWAKLADARILEIAHLIDKQNYYKACIRIYGLESYLKEKELSAEETVTMLKSNVTCNFSEEILFIESNIDRAEQLSDKNRNADAFLLLEQAIEKGEAYLKENKIKRAQLTTLYATGAWYGILSQKFSDAEMLSNIALVDNDASLWMHTNLAHSLLFQNKFEEAIKIYKAYIDEEIAPGEKWQKVIEDDFKKFTEIGLVHSDYSKVLEQLQTR